MSNAQQNLGGLPISWCSWLPSGDPLFPSPGHRWEGWETQNKASPLATCSRENWFRHHRLASLSLSQAWASNLYTIMYRSSPGGCSHLDLHVQGTWEAETTWKLRPLGLCPRTSASASVK